jgi:predicted phage terminase large subunit-like protein
MTLPASLWPEEESTSEFAQIWDEAAAPIALVHEPASMPLRKFIAEGWAILDPGSPFRPNWHIDAICEHLEAATRGEIQQLVISIPPGHAKSRIVSVFWHPWIWTWWPEWRGIFGSYGAQPVAPSMRDSVNARSVIVSDWYQANFHPQWKLTGDQNVKSYYRNTKTGERLSLTVGAGTGFRGNAVVIDDPINLTDRFSEIVLESVKDWWDKAMSSRFNDQSKRLRVIIAQRSVVGDLTGHVLAQGGYEHLCLPSEYDPKRRAVTSLGFADPRTEPGELLFPALFPKEVLDQAKKDLGSIDYSAQHQQLPVPMSGGIFQREWFTANFYTKLPVVFHEIIDSWDMSFKDTKSSDYVVGDRWARMGADVYLLRQRRGQMNYPTSRKEVRDFSQAPTIPYGSTTVARTVTGESTAGLKLVEDKANGPAIIADLRNTIPGLVAVEPEGSKQARAASVSPMCQAGNVHLPDPSIWPEVSEWLDEICTFPKGVHDDRVDSFTQALSRLKKHIQGGEGTYPEADAKMSEAAAVANERY